MASTGFPKWLLDGKEEISRSSEWSEFVEELYDAIQQQLKESHVQAFTDLTGPERQLFMERAAKAIHGGNPYGELYDKVSETLDKRLNNEVSRQLLEDYPINTKTDLILDAAQEGAVSLLKKWPDMKSKLHICFNQPLPRSLRQLAWRLYLENTKVRKRYADLLANNPRSAISKLDFEISQKCEQLLLSEPTFSDLKGSVGAFYAMKAVLSHHHATRKISGGLPDIDYLLTIPFVVVASPNLSRRDPASANIVALLVEEYFTFLHSRPGYMVDSGSEEHDKILLAFCKKVAQNIKQNSPETAAAITGTFVSNTDDWNNYQKKPHPAREKTTGPKTPNKEDPASDTKEDSNQKKEGPVAEPPPPDPDRYSDPYRWHYESAKSPGGSQRNKDNSNENNAPAAADDDPGNTNNNNNEKIIATEAGALAILSDVLVDLVRPLIRSLFVGYVRMDVLLFLWDQYIIGLDAPGFHDEYLPAVTAVFFILLKEQIKACQSMKKHFGKDLLKLLNQDDRAALPVLDPTQANYRPWVYWFSDNIPPRTTPQERRKARDEREAERERLLLQQQEAEKRRKEEEEARRFENEQELLEKLAQDKQRQEEDRAFLEKKLEEERQRRLEAERNAEDEIQRLKREIEDLKRQRPRSTTSVMSLESTISRYLIPPPPTAASRMASQAPALTPVGETPRASSPPQRQADDVLLNLLKRVSHGFTTVGHGRGEEKEQLDQQTREYIMYHKDDVKAAEIEVFGHQLTSGEFMKLTPKEQKSNSDKIMEVLQRKLQERRQKDIDSQRYTASGLK